MPPTDTAARTRLDPASVVDVALEVVDTEGLEALTLRRLAKELGVTPTALYWHFADKQALLDALADRLWSDAHERITASGTGEVWDELRQIFGALVEVFRRHPAVAPLAPTRVIDCPAGLATTERALELLGRAGYDDVSAADAARFLLCAAIMLVTSQPGSWVADAAEREQMMRQKRAAIVALRPGSYPRVEALAGRLLECDVDDNGYFDLGVELIVAGVRALSGGAATPDQGPPAG